MDGPYAHDSNRRVTMNANAIRKPSAPQVRELSTTELQEVAGGFVEILVYAAGSTYAYYRYLKWADKI
jgi:hypothetical protein